jgi:hypothetical protein
MSTGDRAAQLTRLLSAAARAHHEAIGGPNVGWSQWYAEHLVDHDLAAHIGFHTTVEEVAEWLQDADQKHRTEASDRPWPPYYAEVILRRLDGDPRSSSGES